jgi:predicted hotdog family 3-hydroxylacyl-ACP dehydratase
VPVQRERARVVDRAVDRLAVGDELTIVANKLFGQDRMAAFTGTVTRGDAVCATVELSVVDAALAATQVGSGDAP